MLDEISFTKIPKNKLSPDLTDLKLFFPRNEGGNITAHKNISRNATFRGDKKNQ